jgi:hypothetical protein
MVYGCSWFLSWSTRHLALDPSYVLYLQHRLCPYLDALCSLTSSSTPAGPPPAPATPAHPAHSSLSHGFTRRASLRFNGSSVTTAAASNVSSSVSSSRCRHSPGSPLAPLLIMRFFSGFWNCRPEGRGRHRHIATGAWPLKSQLVAALGALRGLSGKCPWTCCGEWPWPWHRTRGPASADHPPPCSGRWLGVSSCESVAAWRRAWRNPPHVKDVFGAELEPFGGRVRERLADSCVCGTLEVEVLDCF